MEDTFAIRPIAELGIGATGGGDPARCLAVAGRSQPLFAAAEIIARDRNGSRRRRLSALELRADAEPRLAQLLAQLERPRAPIAGLSFEAPRIMGIVNVTPDSFADGGRYFDVGAAVEHALRLEAEGADILDVGGESTRPGAAGIDVEEECRRVLPVIAALRAQARVPISIDTRQSEVMRRALAAGVRLINDVSALRHDPSSLPTVAQTGAPVVLMHAQGDPATMQKAPQYADVVLDVYDFFAARIAASEAAGIPRSRLILDPGIGFGKTLAHNLALLASLSLFHALGCVVMLGASRKSFIGHLTGAPAAERLPGSLAAALMGAAQGVQILRVHDVAATRQALTVWQA
ncbi:MAG TPA: dihydropteroate synthase [Hyphomicrobiaceae bacterium]|nr:dihydropteroate synthase [Hyphomicrobiaceae bacterium]